MQTKLSPRLMAIIAATAAAGASGVAIAGAANTGSTTTPATSSTPSTQQQQRPMGGPGAGETALTGDTKTQVEKAALAKVPGTVIRSETDNGGVYEAHVRKSDGTEVEVKVDKDFNVTGVETRPAGGPGFGGRGHGGPGGGMHADLAAVAKTLGVSESKLQSAVQAARPDKGDHGDLAAAIAKELGAKTADVQAVLDANRPDRSAGRPAPGTRPDMSALVSALAKKLGVSEAKVQAALDAVHKAHDADRASAQSDFYAAVAKAIGKDAAAVQKAFEANRPQMPTP